MIPSQNTSYVVCETAVDRIDDLVDAMVAAGILPTSIPSDRPYIEHTHQLDRFDLKFEIQARVEFDVPHFDVVDPAGATPYVRVSLRIKLGQAIITTKEVSTGNVLAVYHFELSGRMAVTGIAGVDAAESAAFFAFKSFEFDLDDYSLGTPLLLPQVDLQLLIGRVGNREIRTRLTPGAPLPEKRFPITPALKQAAGLNFDVMGLVFRSPIVKPDPFAQPQCLVSGGIPACQPVPPSPATFWQAADIFAGVHVGAGGSPIPINAAGRQFQLDVGSNVLANLLQMLSQEPIFHKQKDDAAGGLFQASYDFGLSLVPWPGGGNDAGILLHGTASAYQRGIRVKICHKSVLGVSIPYPCGVELVWWKIGDVDASAIVRPKLVGTQLCIERTDVQIHDHIQFWFLLETFILGTVLGFFLGVPELGFMLVIIVELLDKIVEFLVNAILPTQACVPITKFLKVPIVDGRINLTVSNPFLEFKTTGLTIAMDGDFSKV